MRLSIALAALFVFALAAHALPQSGRRQAGSDVKKSEQPKPAETKTPEPASQDQAEDTSQPEDDEGEAVKVETNLVTVPVIVSDRGGRYVADMKAEEFSVAEDGAEQRVAFFATVTEPFHVVLMIDTSASTTVEKLRQVQDAAVAFLDQLQPGDDMKVISFDDDIRQLCDFTSDRATLASAIRSTRPGKGTRLYDAFDLAFRSLRRLKGRKAIVMLTDGVDFHSDRRTYADNRREVEEGDTVVYPVRFDTRAETEQLARQQSRGGGPVDLGTILGGNLPGVPGTVVVNPRGTQTPRDTGDPSRDASRGGYPGDITRTTNPPTNDPTDESIRNMLDNLYKIADDYLGEMANATGGVLVRADNPSMLPRAFQQIAAELRTQYSLGYYPTNSARDGKYRKIHVRTTRSGLAVRTRPGYRARK